jgi:hypothetical protein
VVAGKCTQNGLELHESQGNRRYHKIRPEAEAEAEAEAIERLWADLFLDAHRQAPGRNHPRSARQRS